MVSLIFVTNKGLIFKELTREDFTQLAKCLEDITKPALFEVTFEDGVKHICTDVLLRNYGGELD